MHDHDEHNRREPDDQLFGSVLEALPESVTQIQVLKQSLKKDAPSEGG
jgi:hypothetical protein